MGMGMETGSPANPNLYSAIITTSVAQVCRSAGYSSLHPSTLCAFSDIVARYILSIGRLSAASAASHNRTECNLLDLVLSLETLYSVRGFPGGSDPTWPLLESAVLKELMAFVRRVDEIPFAKPIPIVDEISFSSSSSSCSSRSLSFAQTGKEVPIAMAHVPKWLPCFPDSWEGWREEEKSEEAPKLINCNSPGELVKSQKKPGSSFDWLEKRGRVSFRIGSAQVPVKRTKKGLEFGG